MAVDLTAIYNSARENLPDRGMFAYMLGKQDVYKVSAPAPKMDYLDRIQMFASRLSTKYGSKKEEDEGEQHLSLARRLGESSYNCVSYH